MGSPFPPCEGAAVAAFGVVQAGPEALAALRKQPGLDTGMSLAPGLLRHADEQAVVAVAAVRQAIQDFRMRDRRFTHWGIVAAPCFLGRSITAAAFDRYGRQGPRGVSPTATPNCSLHAVSALISVALQCKGPNLGVGGGPDAAADGLLAALTLLEEHIHPGVWLAVTGWEPEPHADGGPPAVCHAAALALVPAAEYGAGPLLHYAPQATTTDGTPSGAAELCRLLACRSGRWSYPLRGGGEITWAHAMGAAA